MNPPRPRRPSPCPRSFVCRAVVGGSFGAPPPPTPAVGGRSVMGGGFRRQGDRLEGFTSAPNEPTRIVKKRQNRLKTRFWGLSAECLAMDGAGPPKKY